MKVPAGSTHFIPGNPLDFEPAPTFMKWGQVMWLPESCRYLYGWYNWTGSYWGKDPSFSNRLGFLKPIEEFSE